jgi:hypothetical protein
MRRRRTSKGILAFCEEISPECGPDREYGERTGTLCYGAKESNFDIRIITPRRDSKGVRLNDHLPKIRNKQIHVPEYAIWREAFIAEIVGFPDEFDDQVDAMTQYLDFMATKPIIPMPRPRATSVVVFTPPFSRRAR